MEHDSVAVSRDRVALGLLVTQNGGQQSRIQLVAKESGIQKPH